MSFRFDPANPFPLLDVGSVSYSLQKDHAEAADLYFGYRISEIENGLIKQVQQTGAGEQADLKKQQWIGLRPSTLQTPYTELRFMLSVLHLKPGDTVADLGAGYGRMGLVIHKHFQDCNFVGVEIAKARADEGNRLLRKWGGAKGRIIHADASDPNFELPGGQFYFIYDLSVLATIKRVLDKLKSASRLSPICVIGRGRATRDQIERNEPWLSQIVAPEYFSNFTIYRSREC